MQKKRQHDKRLKRKQGFAQKKKRASVLKRKKKEGKQRKPRG